MIKSTNLNPNDINHIKGNNYDDSQKLEYTTMIGGGGTSEYKRKNLVKRLKRYPKGDGNSKPPIIPKRKAKIRKK